MQTIAVENLKVEALIPYARNAKQHTDAQVAQIAASIREFGWGAPILADNKIGENASWDDELLGLELTELRDKNRAILNDNLGEGFGQFLHDTCSNIALDCARKKKHP